jgi:hypothetical protein
MIKLKTMKKSLLITVLLTIFLVSGYAQIRGGSKGSSRPKNNGQGHQGTMHHGGSSNGEAVMLPEGRTFIIQSALRYGVNQGAYWDFSGVGNVGKDKRLQIWDLDNGADRKFRFIRSSSPGFYEIAPASNRNMRIDVAGGDSHMANNGNKLVTWDRNGHKCQQFKFVHLGDGRFKIYTHAGHAICTDGRHSGNGTKVNIWADHNGAWMEWYLIDPATNRRFIPSASNTTSSRPYDAAFMQKARPVVIQSALRYGIDQGAFWDFPMIGDVYKDLRLQIWDLDNGADRVFHFVEGNKDGYYEIVPRSNWNQRVDVAGGGSNMARNGNKLITWDRNQGEAQQFKFVHLGNGKYKIYTLLGHAICTDGRNSGNGTKVNIWEDHNGPWMEWYILDANTRRPIYPEQ